MSSLIENRILVEWCKQISPDDFGFYTYYYHKNKFIGKISLETIQDFQAFQGISVVDVLKDNFEYEYFSVTSPNNVCVKSYRPTIIFYNDDKNRITKEKNWRNYVKV